MDSLPVNLQGRSGGGHGVYAQTQMLVKKIEGAGTLRLWRPLLIVPQSF
jgi:hypothetical protein